MNAIIAELHNLYPSATCWDTRLLKSTELLVATQLSAQCTDVRVNIVTKQLFQKYKSAEDYATAKQEELEQDIRSTGFYRNKAKNIRATGQRLLTAYNGEVPHSMEELLTLPGVARKTANVVLGYAFGIEVGIVVDTHVGRLSRRLGWTTNDNAVKVEQDLMHIIPHEEWLNISHMLIFHGRAICDSRKPLCEQCTLAHLCPSAFVAKQLEA